MTQSAVIQTAAFSLSTLAPLIPLAMDALPVDEMDYGSDRQVAAETLFFEQCRELFPSDFEEGSRFYNFCLKATPEEMIEEAVKILASKLGRNASLPA